MKSLITTAELDALAVALGNMVGRPQEPELVSLLRKLHPGHAVLARLDAIARHVADEEAVQS